MGIKYWEYEDAPLREKLKNPNVKEVAKIYFENETKAYRFAKALSEVKKKGNLRLKDCSKELPLATWKRYLDFGVNVGILKHESNAYSFTDRYSKPLKNISVYIKSWIDSVGEEKMDVLFANAKTEKQQKRGGRRQLLERPENPMAGAPMADQEAEKEKDENIAA
ncbi:MAG: hypothetical protein KGH71_05760 [Candidatus Micrarchaeota archaeon]|nr:hypothetical protein [Candidatus Micrarchaeota archaeon]